MYRPLPAARSVSRGRATSGAAAAIRPATWRVLRPAACLINSRWRCGSSSGVGGAGGTASGASGNSPVAAMYRSDAACSDAAWADPGAAANGKLNNDEGNNRHREQDNDHMEKSADDVRSHLFSRRIAR